MFFTKKAAQQYIDQQITSKMATMDEALSKAEDRLLQVENLYGKLKEVLLETQNATSSGLNELRNSHNNMKSLIDRFDKELGAATKALQEASLKSKKKVTRKKKTKTKKKTTKKTVSLKGRTPKKRGKKK